MPDRPLKVCRWPPRAVPRREIFGEAARQQRALAVEAEAHAVTDAGGEGNHIFQRAGGFHADHVVGGVEPEAARGEGALYALRRFRGGRGDDGGGGQPGGDFGGNRRPGNDRIAGGVEVCQFLLADLRDAEEGVALDALHQTDNGGLRGEMPHAAQHAAAVLRGESKENDLGARNRRLQFGSDADIGVQRNARQILLIDARARDEFRLRHVELPEA